MLQVLKNASNLKSMKEKYLSSISAFTKCHRQLRKKSNFLNIALTLAKCVFLFLAWTFLNSIFTVLVHYFLLAFRSSLNLYFSAKNCPLYWLFSSIAFILLLSISTGLHKSGSSFSKRSAAQNFANNFPYIWYFTVHSQ